jgi:hypothetical protein
MRYLGVWYNRPLSCVETEAELSYPSSKGIILMTGDNGTVKVPTPYNSTDNAQDPSLFLLRNSKLSATETNPTTNGEIVWVYD